MSVPAPSFQDLDDALSRAESEFGAAEAHGLLCGLICVQGMLDLRQLQREVFGPNADEHNVAVRQAGEQLGVLRGLTLTQLAGGDLGFAPLLPEDGESLARRSAQLGAWCRGYLYGLGLAGMPEPAKLSPEARELLVDLGEIGRSDFEAIDDDEADENAYVEILEYVRMGAILLHDELQPDNSPKTHH